MDNYFPPLVSELKGRVTTPIGHPSFLVFFFGGIIFFGGSGVWYEMLGTETFASVGGNSGRIVSSVVTYFPAVAGVTVLQGILGERESYMRGFFTFMALILLTPSAYLLFSTPVLTNWVIFLVIACTVITLLLAWILHANQASLFDRPIVTVGGKADGPLQGDGKF